MYMYNTHVYEVGTDQVLFRRAGSQGYDIAQCMIVSTRAFLVHRSSAGQQLPKPLVEVSISVLLTGFQTVVFDTWFPDWSKDDNLSQKYLQSGRPVDVAVPIRDYQRMLVPGAQSASEYPQQGDDQFAPNQPFSRPVAAIRIQRYWHEPVADPRQQSQADQRASAGLWFNPETD